MKTKDRALVVLIAGFTGLFMYVVSNSFISGKKSMRAKVEVVEPISKDFNFANKPYFKANSINPTREIIIDVNNNTIPIR